jgi:hypothetical protein
VASEPSAAQRIRDSIAALPSDQRGPWVVDPETTSDGPLSAYVMLMDPRVGEALANLLDGMRRCLDSDPQPCDHEETDECIADLADLGVVLEAAILREAT